MNIDCRSLLSDGDLHGGQRHASLFTRLALGRAKVGISW